MGKPCRPTQTHETEIQKYSVASRIVRPVSPNRHTQPSLLERSHQQIASMNDSYGYTTVNCVWPHSSISELAGVFCNKLTADAGWRRCICIYVDRSRYMYYVDHLDPNLLFWGAVQGPHITDPTRATCPTACSICGSYPATWARSHRSGICLPWKS